MTRSIKIKCHGCKREVSALVLKEYYIIKNTKHKHKDGQSYPSFTRLKIRTHNKGLLKGRCNRSGKIYRIKSRFYPDDD